MGIDAGLLAALIEPGFGARGVLGRRQIEDGEEIADTKCAPASSKSALRSASTRPRPDRETAVGIGRGLAALRLDEDRPARAETAEGVVDAAGDGDQLGGDGGIQIGTAEARRALERAVLVEDDALGDERGPGQIVGKAGRCGDIRQGSSWRCASSDRQMSRGCADGGGRPRRRADRAWPPTRPRNGRWPRSARPTSQRRRPRPTAPASVPLRMAMERGAPPSRMCSVSAR
jgi:hypothetical protein